MQQIGLWHVTASGPQQLKTGAVELEKHLEDWIEKDPSLLQVGFTIVGRQVVVEGGRLDLLAIDTQGRWAVIEIKSGTIYRDTIAQALDYASCVATMPYRLLSEKVNSYLRSRSTETLETLMEEQSLDTADGSRDVEIYVVGTGRAPGLERMASYLSTRYSLPINIVSYQVYGIADGHQLLVRELSSTEVLSSTEADNQSLPQRAETSLEEITAKADKFGVGKDFRRVLEAAQKHGMNPRVFQHSIMYTPPSNRTRMLFTVKANPKRGDNRLQVYVWPQAFSEFYPVSPEKAAIDLGIGTGWRKMTSENVDAFLEGLDNIFHEVSMS